MRRSAMSVLLAGFAALAAAIVVYSALKRREAEVQQAMVKSVEIVAAAHDLPIGAKLDSSAVKLVRWSRDDIPPGAFTDLASVMNQYVRTGFVRNEPIVADRLFSGDKNAGVLPLLIPAGMRAVSVPVDEVSDIAGFVLPHARVDILVSVSNNGSGGDKPFSKIVLQNVEVLAVAQEIESVQDKPEVVKVVTFLVTPEEAERLTLASREGALRLALRNYDDKKIVTTNGVDIAQMLRAYEASQPAVPLMTPQHVGAVTRARPRVKPVEVEIMRNGRSTEEVSFIKSGDSSSRVSTSASAASVSSAADSPGKYTSVVPDPASATSGRPSAPAANAAPAAVLAKPPSENEALGVVDFAAPMPINPHDGFNTPRSKTIDVP